MTGRKDGLILLLVIMVALVTALFPEVVFAGAGGLIKMASKSWAGKIVFFGIVLFFLPLIFWFMIKRSILVRRTRRSLNRLARIAPHFDWPPLRERIVDVFMWVQSTWDYGKLELARDYMTEHYFRNQQLILERWEKHGLINVTTNVKIKSIVPLYIAHDPQEPSGDRIVVEIDAEMRDYLMEKTTGKVVQGDKTLGDLSAVWTFAFENDRWVVRNIEDGATALDYLTRPDIYPAPLKERVR